MTDPKKPNPDEQDLPVQRDELREFLMQAAVSLVVEAGAPGEAEEPEPPPPPPPARKAQPGPPQNTMRVGILYALVITLVAAGTWLLWPRDVVTTLPDALVGEWVTTSPRYPGRVMSLTTTEVGFLTQGNMPVHPITSVTTRRADLGEQFLIEYETATGPYTLDVIQSGETLTFTNQRDVVWTRKRR